MTDEAIKRRVDAASRYAREEMRREIEEALDRLTTARADLCIASVNAGRCGGRDDYRKMTEAEDEYGRVRDEVIARLETLVWTK